ncbi:MAG: SemiSWEET transporter [Chitinophagales bacterium]|nr:SemiSWEET transporter [Chitinophagales bacterium]
MSNSFLVEGAGIVAGLFTASSLLPQVIKTYKEKKAEEISVFMLVILMAGLILWIFYGILKEDIPIIATNCFSLLVNITLMILRFVYSGKK